MRFQSASPPPTGRPTRQRDVRLVPGLPVSIRSPADGETHPLSGLGNTISAFEFQSAPPLTGRLTVPAGRLTLVLSVFQPAPPPTGRPTCSGTWWLSLKPMCFNPIPRRRGDPPARARGSGSEYLGHVSIRSPADGETHLEVVVASAARILKFQSAPRRRGRPTRELRRRADLRRRVSIRSPPTGRPTVSPSHGR